MRLLGTALILILGLTACNMTTANQPQDQSDTQAIALASAEQSSTATKVPTATPTRIATNTPIAQGPVPSCIIRVNWQVYMVVSGDTLGQIAQRAGTSVDELVTANCLNDANTISVGQALRVPSLPPVPVVTNTTTSANLREVGAYIGRPVLESCWVSNPGTSPLVYDAVNGQPIAVLVNRLHVMSGTSTWLQVSIHGTDTIPDTSGWMRVDQVSLIGHCTEVTGVYLDSFRGIDYGIPGHVPTDVCGVVTSDPSKKIPVYGEFEGLLYGYMTSWGKWVSTQGNFYQVEFEWTGYADGPGTVVPPVPIFGWVDKSLVTLVNCSS